MASEVAGLDPLHGYLKHGNLVLRMRFPYLELEGHAEKYIERKATACAVARDSKAGADSRRAAARGRADGSAEEAAEGRKTARATARPGKRATSLLRVDEHGDDIETYQLADRLRRITSRSSLTPKRTTTRRANVYAASGRASLPSGGD